MKNEKIGITPIDWALSIFGILVLACFIILPPVFRIAFKEKAKIVNPDQPVVENMTCSKNNFVTNGYITSDSIKFTYIGDKINVYSRKIDMSFDELESYEQQKQEYGRAANMYSFVKDKGVKYTVTPDDGNLKIKVEEEFNLGSFQPTSVTIPGDTEETQITSEYSRNDSVKEIKADLTASGYSCK